MEKKKFLELLETLKTLDREELTNLSRFVSARIRLIAMQDEMKMIEKNVIFYN